MKIVKLKQFETRFEGKKVMEKKGKNKVTQQRGEREWNQMEDRVTVRKGLNVGSRSITVHRVDHREKSQ